MASKSVLVVACLAVLAISSEGLAGQHMKDGCEQCLFGLRVLDDILADPEVVTTMVSFTETSICPSSTPTGDKCRNLAEGLLPVILQWIRLPATNWQICKAMGSCKSKVEPMIAPQQASDQCPMCQLVVMQVQHMLNNTEVFHKINATAQQACLALPPEIATLCLNFVNQYEPLMEKLIMHAKPEELCQMLGMCPIPPAALLLNRWQPGSRRLQQLLYKAPVNKPQPAKLGDSCTVCQMAVIEAHSLVANPAVQASLVNYTKALCGEFPSLKETCNLYIDTYAPVVFSMLEQALARPDTVCAQMGMCSTSKRMIELVRASLRTQIQSQHPAMLTFGRAI